jgi:two-component system response regulator (stage 0 sporulation protein F)
MSEGKRILVLDDEEHIRTYYTMELEDEGYRVTAVEECRKGLERIKKGEVDLLILDIRMPDMDGREVLSQVRDIDINLPIVISSAYPIYKQEFGVWAADDFFVKEHDLTKLKEKVRKLLEKPEKEAGK